MVVRKNILCLTEINLSPFLLKQQYQPKKIIMVSANEFFKGKTTTLISLQKLEKQLFLCFRRLGNLLLAQRYITLNKSESTTHLELV